MKVSIILFTELLSSNITAAQSGSIFWKIMKQLLKNILDVDANYSRRSEWLTKALRELTAGHRILDAGAGELRNKPLCNHLNYVSQDFCQYDGRGDGSALQVGSWDTRAIDLVCDVSSIHEPDASFDAVLCSEVFEHLPDPLKAISEFSRLLKSGGKIILTAPFASLVHFAPYYFTSGFSRYWYEYHLPLLGFKIIELTPNGDYFSYLKQEFIRLPAIARSSGDKLWPLAYFAIAIPLLYFLIRGRGKDSDLACFGWHCIAEKR